MLWSAVLGAAFAILTVFERIDFALDDAYIHLAYAKSLRVGDGLSYNPGDYETGFSSPLWVFVLAIWPIPNGVGSDPVRAVALLGALFHAATAMAGAALTLELLRLRSVPERPLPLWSLTMLSGALVTATPTLLTASTSGMEVSLAAATVTACAWAIVAGRPLAAGLLGGLAVLARPESLAFVVVMGGVAAWRLRTVRGSACRTAVAAPLGAVTAIALWVLYNLTVSGRPWPNAHYVKQIGASAAGLRYLTSEVLPWQPWLVSLTGVLLLARAVWSARKRSEGVACRDFPFVEALLLAVLLTWVGTAGTRALHPGVQFYESRYFMPVAAIPATLIPLGLSELGRWWSLAATLPLALVSGLQCAELEAAAEGHAADTHAVHTDVARDITERLPDDAIVAVEGAGALRYFTPRSMQIVDLVGLNDGAAAQLHRHPIAKICHGIARKPTHLVIPAPWVSLFSGVYRLRPLAAFDDPNYTQVDPPHPHAVLVFAIESVDERWLQRCRDDGGSHIAIER